MHALEIAYAVTRSKDLNKKKSIIKNSKNSAVQTTFAGVVKSTASFYAPNAFINFDLGGPFIFPNFFYDNILGGKKPTHVVRDKKKFLKLVLMIFSVDFWPSYFRRIWGSYSTVPNKRVYPAIYFRWKIYPTPSY